MTERQPQMSETYPLIWKTHSNSLIIQRTLSKFFFFVSVPSYQTIDDLSSGLDSKMSCSTEAEIWRLTRRLLFDSTIRPSAVLSNKPFSNLLHKHRSAGHLILGFFSIMLSRISIVRSLSLSFSLSRSEQAQSNPSSSAEEASLPQPFKKLVESATPIVQIASVSAYESTVGSSRNSCRRWRRRREIPQTFDWSVAL